MIKLQLSQSEAFAIRRCARRGLSSATSVAEREAARLALAKLEAVLESGNGDGVSDPWAEKAGAK